MRYSQPRKLRTKRGSQRAAVNAWCLGCRAPMARHGKNFTCSPCHVATRIQSSFGIRSVVIRVGRLQPRDSHPWCFRCRVMMQRMARQNRAHAYRCAKCKVIAVSRDSQARRLEREKRIVEMVDAGYLNAQIVRRLRCHSTTVNSLRNGRSPRLCECGHLFYHVTRCRKRPGWQTVAKQRRTDFENLLVRINRRIPSALPEEMRGEIAQTMLFDIAIFCDQTIKNTSKYIARYKVEYPWRMYSLDDSALKLAERLAG